MALLDNLKTDKIDVGVAATEIVVANYKRKDIVIYNNGAQTVFIDNTSGDCTLDSFPLLAGSSLTLQGYQGELHGIVAAATCEVRIIYTQY
jgi:hypothetical protein